MTDRTKRALIVILWQYPNEREGLGTEDRKTYEQAAAVYKELRAEEIHPVVLIAPAQNTELNPDKRIAVAESVRNHIVKSDLIPGDHILYPAAVKSETSTVEITWHHKERLEKQCGHEIEVYIFPRNWEGGA